MTQLFADGFESGNLNAWDSQTDDDVTVVTSPVRLGTYAAQMTIDEATETNSGITKAFTASNTVNVRAFVRIASVDTGTVFTADGKYVSYIMLLDTTGAIVALAGLMRDSGAVKWFLKYASPAWGTMVFATAPTPVANTWFCLEIKILKSATVGEARMYVDGVEVITQTSQNTGATLINQVELFSWHLVPAPYTTLFADYVIVADQYIGLGDLYPSRKRLLQIASGGCVCYLPMWEGAGTRVEDVSLANNHGAITGASWATGELRNGLSFDGNDYVDCGHDASLEPLQVTITAWVKPSAIIGAANFTIATKQNWDGTGYIIYITTDGVGGYFACSAGDGVNTAYISDPAQAELNKWQYIAMVVETDGDIYLYKNGVQVVADTTTLTGLAQNGTSLTIGKLSWADSQYFQGIIDEVRIWNRALSATEIALDYYRTCRGSY